MEFIAQAGLQGSSSGSIKLTEIFSCGNLEIPLVIKKWLGVKRLKPNWKRLGLCTSWTCLGEGGEGVVCFGVWEAPFNDWANGGSDSVNDFYTYGEYGFSFKGSWSYSK